MNSVAAVFEFISSKSVYKNSSAVEHTASVKLENTALRQRAHLEKSK